jgi:hypothetical protein
MKMWRFLRWDNATKWRQLLVVELTSLLAGLANDIFGKTPGKRLT